MLNKRSPLRDACYVGLLAASLQSLPDSAAQQALPASASLSPSAEIFAPGIISGPANDGSPTFSPDGNTLFFTRSSARWSIVLESHRVHGSWSQPEIASFSGEWSDSSPAMSPDGSYLVFVSMRPASSGSEATAQSDKNAAPKASHIWRVNRTGSNWSAPVELPESVNFCQWIFRPSVAADGSVYFTALEKGKELRLFRSLYENGVYRHAEPLSFSDGSIKDVDPEIAPDQSFLIFSSKGRRADENSHEHLFIVYSKGGTWSAAAPMRYAGDDANGSSDDNDARLGPERRTLYFSSDRSVTVHFPRTPEQAIQDFDRLKSWDNSNSNVWVISLAPWLPAGNG